MSTCGNCDCADKSQCVKKGNSYGVEIIETEKRWACPNDNVKEAFSRMAASNQLQTILQGHCGRSGGCGCCA